MTLTRDGGVLIRGLASGGNRVEVSAPSRVFEVDVRRGRFEAKVPLLRDRVNRIYFTTMGPGDRRSAVRATAVTHDSEAPRVFVDDILRRGSTAEVAGRVGDRLCGDRGIKVLVNGVAAEVDVGSGSNGTFYAKDVPLEAGERTVTVVATDAVGNSTEEQALESIRSRGLLPKTDPRTLPFGTIEAVSGGGQITQVNTEVPQALVVRIVKPDGTPFTNKLVNFRVKKSDGLLSAKPDPFDGELRVASGGPGMPRADWEEAPPRPVEKFRLLQVFTDHNGEARAFWTLGSESGCGNNKVEASSTSIEGLAVFLASSTPAPPDQINVSSGNSQRVQVGAPAPEPLVAWVSDSCNPVAGVDVTFTVVGGSGQVNGLSEVTVSSDGGGLASVSFVLGPEPGNQEVEATFEGNATEPARFVIFGVDPSAGSTSFSGVVLDNAGRPLRDATCTLEIPPGSPLPSVLTDAEGQFRFDSLAQAGPAHLVVDGTTVTEIMADPTPIPVPPETFPALSYEIPEVSQRAENTLPSPIVLPELNPNRVSYDGSAPVTLTVPGIEGLEMRVKAGTSVTHPDGTPADENNPIELWLSQVHFDDVPMPMPNGAAPPFSWTLQPSGATFAPPLEVVYPNMSGLPPGGLSFFFSFDHDTNMFEIVARGRVSEDGSCIVSDPGEGVGEAGWGCNCPPYAVTGNCHRCSQGVCPHGE